MQKWFRAQIDHGYFYREAGKRHRVVTPTGICWRFATRQGKDSSNQPSVKNRKMEGRAPMSSF